MEDVENKVKEVESVELGEQEKGVSQSTEGSKGEYVSTANSIVAALYHKDSPAGGEEEEEEEGNDSAAFVMVDLNGNLG